MRRALIVKLAAIGDVVMAIPAAHELYKNGYEIDWMCGQVVAPVLRLYPWIRVIPVDESRLLRKGKLAAIGLLAGIWRTLGLTRYDLCATLYYDGRYRLLTLPVRARRRISLSMQGRGSRLLETRHHTDEYVRILLGTADGETPRQVPPVRPDGLPPCPLQRVEGKPRVVLVPGGARNLLRDDALRRWPLANYVTLAAHLLDQGREVVLAGGPEDAWVSSAFEGVSVTNLVGKLPLAETLALLDSADLTVTHDTGPLHLAGLTRSAILAIFGPTDPHGRLPQVPNAVALWGGEGFACRPCYDGRDYAPCTHNGCMNQVTPFIASLHAQVLLRYVSEGEQVLPRVVAMQHTPLPQLGLLPYTEAQ